MVIFPIHPRTKSNLVKMNLMKGLSENLVLCDPIGYVDFLCLVKNARLIITDSGGIQEESTYLGVQCITLRENTERPVTIDLGTNHLVGTDINAIDRAIADVFIGKVKKGNTPPLWDGRSAERICSILVEKIERN
jgi:UDP-N-acetylglucosamine 2-epimerase (non-hydrolysing)